MTGTYYDGISQVRCLRMWDDGVKKILKFMAALREPGQGKTDGQPASPGLCV